MGYNEWYAFRTNNKFLDFTEFVLQIANKFEQNNYAPYFDEYVQKEYATEINIQLNFTVQLQYTEVIAKTLQQIENTFKA